LNGKKTYEVTFQEEHTVASKNQNTCSFSVEKKENKFYFKSAGTRNLHFVPSASVAPLVAEHMSISLQPYASEDQAEVSHGPAIWQMLLPDSAGHMLLANVEATYHEPLPTLHHSVLLPFPVQKVYPVHSEVCHRGPEFFSSAQH